MSETPVNENQQKVAILIDGENVSADLADLIFSNAVNYGEIAAREIYGTATALTSWIQPVLKYAIHTNLTVKASKSKNSSDISLVIGAMDLLNSREIGTMIIVSSDSDFSALSVRLRSGGMNVVGMGAEKANPLWRMACSSFVVLNEKKTATQGSAVSRSAAPAPVQRLTLQPANAAPVQRTTPQPAIAAPVQRTAPQPTIAASAPKSASQSVAVPVKNPTHEERLNHIRNRIDALLKEENGRMPVTKLFQHLNRFHDYQVDQAGSKRKPLNYLMWAFGNTFYFEEAPSGMIISLEPSSAAQEKTAEEAETEKAERDTLEKEKTAEKAGAEKAERDTLEKEKTAEKAGAEKAEHDTEEKEKAVEQMETGIADEPAAKTGTSSTKVNPEGKIPSKKVPAKTKSAAKKTVEQVAAATLEMISPAEIAAPATADSPEVITPAETAALEAAASPEVNIPSEMAASAANPSEKSIEEVKAIPSRIRKALTAAGYTTLGEAAQVSDAELQAIPQVGAATIATFRKTMNELLGKL